MTDRDVKEATATPRRKKKRVFLWFFMAVQLLFVVWIFAGAGSSGDPSDCGTLSQQACEDAEAVGAGIGIFFIIVIWCIVDFLLGVIYGIYRLAKRT